MNPDSLGTVAEWLAMVRPLVTDVLVPSIKTLWKDRTLRAALHPDALQKTFAEYLSRGIEKHAFIKPLALRQESALLTDLYVPLTLYDPSAPKLATRLDSFPRKLLTDHSHILITDSAGMGKSTALRYLFLRAIPSKAGIPVFLELRKLGTGKSPMELLQEELASVDGPIEQRVLSRLLRRGTFIILLDGYDEIPFERRAEATNALQDFISKAKGNRFIITSRPEGALASFANFRQFAIQPLKRTDAYQLIRQYDRHDQISKELIRKLQNDQLPGIEDFLVNPLLVSLLFCAYQFKATIPVRRSLFYEQVYSALYERHDLTKTGAYVREKHCRLDSESFARILRYVGFTTLKLGRVEYTEPELHDLIAAAKKHYKDLNFRETEFAKDLLTTVPLFVLDGGFVRWSHKSLQEYFAAMFLARDAREHRATILNRMYLSPQFGSYVNTFALYCDVDPTGFRQTVLRPLATEILAYEASERLALQPEGTTETERKRRRGLMFGRQYVVSRTDIAGGIPKWWPDALLKNDVGATSRDIEITVYANGGPAIAAAVSPKIRLLNAIRVSGETLGGLPPVGWVAPNLLKTPFGQHLGEEPLPISNDLANPCNDPKSYKSVTRLLADIHRAVVVDFERARLLLEELDSEHSGPAGSDSLLAGL